MLFLEFFLLLSFLLLYAWIAVIIALDKLWHPNYGLNLGVLSSGPVLANPESGLGLYASHLLCNNGLQPIGFLQNVQ